MRILFDHQVFSWQTYGGISRYVVEQIRGLQALDQEVLLTDGFFSENVYLRNLPGFERKSLTSFPFKGKKWLQQRLGQSASKNTIRKKRPDVFHPTYFDPYFIKTLEKRGIPFVLTVHDMIHEIYGHGSRGMFSLDAHVIENKRFLAEKADAVVAISENTRLDLLRFCPKVDPAKVHVIHHGNALDASLAREAILPADHVVLNQAYLLFVGQRKSYKNFAWMVGQLADLLRSKPKLHLVCVGGSNFDEAETAQFASLGISPKVHYLPVDSDAALAKVYTGASCFIFPSQYEGFGFPVLEAFACNCPVVLNRASSLPEVGGDAALYFDYENPQSLEAAVRSILEDADVRAQLKIRGLERAKRFTWAESVGKHLSLYQSLVQ